MNRMHLWRSVAINRISAYKKTRQRRALWRSWARVSLFPLLGGSQLLTNE